MRRRAPRACRMSLASPVLLAQGLALSTHHTTRPLPALAHGRIHTRPRRSNIRESGRQHARRRRRLLSGWPRARLRRSVGISRIKHVCTYSILCTQSFLGVRALSPSTPSLASHHRARSLRSIIHPIHPPSVSALGGARSTCPAPAPPRRSSHR